MIPFANSVEQVGTRLNHLEQAGTSWTKDRFNLWIVVLSCAWHRPSRKALRWPSRSSLLRWTGSPQPATFRRKSGLDDGHVTCGQQKSRERATLINLTDVVGFKNTEARDRQPETIDGTGRWRQWRYLSWKETKREKCLLYIDDHTISTYKQPHSRTLIPELMWAPDLDRRSWCLLTYFAFLEMALTLFCIRRSDCVAVNVILALQPFRPKFCLALDIRSI